MSTRTWCCAWWRRSTRVRSPRPSTAALGGGGRVTGRGWGHRGGPLPVLGDAPWRVIKRGLHGEAHGGGGGVLPLGRGREVRGLLGAGGQPGQDAAARPSPVTKQPAVEPCGVLLAYNT